MDSSSAALSQQIPTISSTTKSYSDRGTVPRKSSVFLAGGNKTHPSSDELFALNTTACTAVTSTTTTTGSNGIDGNHSHSHSHNHQNNNNHDLAFTIVWSPLPIITWLVPFIGHTGICDSRGTASDFQGPYYVGDDGRMAFGAPTRALKLSGVVAPELWDAAIQRANEEYRGRMHNICCDNCHSHVAYALNSMGANAYGVSKWDMVKIAVLVFVRGRFLSTWAILYQFLPFTLLIVTWLAVTKS